EAERFQLEASGLAKRHLGNFHCVFRIREELHRFEFGLEPSSYDIRSLLDKRMRHHHKAAIDLVDGGSRGDLAGKAFLNQAGRSRLPHNGSIEFLSPETAGDDLYALIEIFRRFESLGLEHRLGEAVRAAPFRYCDSLAIEPLERFIGRAKLRGIRANQEGIALVVAKTKHRNDTYVAHVGVAC